MRTATLPPKLFFGQYQAQCGQDEYIGGYLGFVASEDPLSADDVLPDERHAHDDYGRIQRGEREHAEQGRQASTKAAATISRVMICAGA